MMNDKWLIVDEKSPTSNINNKTENYQNESIVIRSEILNKLKKNVALRIGNDS